MTPKIFYYAQLFCSVTVLLANLSHFSQRFWNQHEILHIFDTCAANFLALLNLLKGKV
jgi:hypothetical protein